MPEGMPALRLPLLISITMGCSIFLPRGLITASTYNNRPAEAQQKTSIGTRWKVEKNEDVPTLAPPAFPSVPSVPSVLKGFARVTPNAQPSSQSPPEASAPAKASIRHKSDTTRQTKHRQRKPAIDISPNPPPAKSQRIQGRTGLSANHNLLPLCPLCPLC